MSTVNPTSANTFVETPAAKKPKQEFNMEMFLQLLTTQLANQNPLEPMSDAEFYGQVAQLGQVQGQKDMISRLDVLQSASLIGREVTAVRTSSTGLADGTVTGTVTKMTVRNGTHYLSIQEPNGGTAEVTLDNIREVKNSA